MIMILNSKQEESDYYFNYINLIKQVDMMKPSFSCLSSIL